MNNVFILIGGASGVGKSTIVRRITEKYGVCSYKRLNAFAEIADDMRIPRNEMFSKIDSKCVDKRMVDKCRENRLLISDQHYALQVQRDNNFALGVQEKLKKENYVATITDHFIALCRAYDIEIVAILLVEDSKRIWERLIDRETVEEKRNRNVNYEDLLMQMAAEEEKWLELMEKGIVTKKIFVANGFEETSKIVENYL